MHTLSTFLSGAVTLGYVVAALLMLKAWRRTKDTLFGCFGAAFGLLALNQLFDSFAAVPDEDKSWFFLLRLAAFVMLIIAIVAKNVATETPGR